MSTLSVSGEPAEFQAFWCDARDRGSDELSLVVLAFVEPFPGDWALAVTGEKQGAQHGMLLFEGNATSPTLIGVPVPAEWAEFTLVLTPFSASAIGPEVPLKFSRDVAQRAPQTGYALHVIEANQQIETRLLHWNRAHPPSLLHLYQRMTADGTLNHPSTRARNSSAAVYQLGIRAPAPAPETSRTTAGHHGLRIRLHARGDDARRMIRYTFLWYASQAQLAPNNSTLGTFDPPDDVPETGFFPVEGVLLPSRETMEFTVQGAAPGDIFCLAPGLEESAVSFGNDPTDPPAKSDKGVFVFEIDSEAGVVQLPTETLERKVEGSKLLEGTDKFAMFVRDQVRHIRERFSGSRKEIYDLSDAFSKVGARDRAAPRSMENAADSPIQFALCVAMLDALLRGVDKQTAQTLTTMLRPDQPRIAERICSAAIRRAAADETAREKLVALTGGDYNPWRAPDGLRAAFEAVFDVTGPRGRDAKRWYEATHTDPMARIALVAIERPGNGQASTMIDAGLKPGLPDVIANDLPVVLSFCSVLLLGQSRDLAFEDAIRWACEDLEGDPHLFQPASALAGRLKHRDSGGNTWEPILPIDAVRKLRAAARADEIAGALDRIRDALELEGEIGSIPRLGLGDKRSAADILTRLEQQIVPARWRKLCEEAVHQQWPAAALGALLKTLESAPPPKDEPLPESPLQNDSEVLRTAATERIPYSAEDMAAASFLFDQQPATELLGQLKDRATRYATGFERELNRIPNASNVRETARKLASDQVVQDIQLLAKRNLQKVQKIFARADEAVRRAQGTLTDSGQQKQLSEIEKLLFGLERSYDDPHQLRLKRVSREGKDVLQVNRLQELESDLQKARDTFYEVSRLKSRIPRTGLDR
jgi:hypothetical protein